MDKKAVIMTIAKDIFIAAATKPADIPGKEKLLKDIVAMVEKAYNSIKT